MKTQTTKEVKRMQRLIDENPLHVSQVMDALAKYAEKLRQEKKNDRPSRKTG